MLQSFRMKYPKLVIFDWDGTLVDSIDPILAGFRRAYERQGHPFPPVDEVRATIGLPLAAAFEQLTPGLPTATMVTLYREYWFDPGRPASPWVEGALQTLDWLKSNDILSAIATGKSRRGAEHELELLNAGPHFVALRSADDAQAKPHPDMVHQILEELKIEPEQAIIVGDSRLDLQMARAAGVPAYGVLGGVGNRLELSRENPLAVLPSVADLSQILMSRMG